MTGDWFARLKQAKIEVHGRPPATRAQIDAAQTRLATRFPPSLIAFFELADGILDEWGYAYAWPLEQLVEDNLDMRAFTRLSLPSDLLGIGGNGAGDWFCVDLSTATFGQVIQYEWIDDEREVRAPDVLAFWPAWFDGSLRSP